MAEAAETVGDLDAVELWGRVIKGFQATSRRLHAMIRREFDLGEAEAETVLNLYRKPDRRAPMAELARAAAFSSGGFTKLADKLTSRGLTERTRSSDDRRVVHLEFTPAGAELAEQLAHAVGEANRTLFIGVLGNELARDVADAMVELYRANRD